MTENNKCEIPTYTLQELEDLYKKPLPTIQRWIREHKIPENQIERYSKGPEDRMRRRVRKEWVDADLERLGIK